MVNINQSENENKELKISPLGTEEINSVIKSFKNSTFNQEELYKKSEKNFVKKTLFDLAKESEQISLKEKRGESNNSLEKNVLEKQSDKSDEIIRKPDRKDELDNFHSLKDLEKKNDNIEKVTHEINTSIDETIKSDEVPEEKISGEHHKADEVPEEKISGEHHKADEVPEEKISGEHHKADEVLEENINGEYNKSKEFSKENLDNGIKGSNEKILDSNQVETHKTEYEEKTLEALDSVREAVTKSLEENNEIKSKEIQNNTDNSKIVSNNIISEINSINTLFKNIREISNDEIENIVKSKVIELAEGVIGYQIEKFPDKFLNKIKNSINEIKSINNDVKIYLNEYDFELLNKYIDKNETEINFRLDLDSSLGRGDFTIDMGGVMQAIKYKKVIE